MNAPVANVIFDEEANDSPVCWGAIAVGAVSAAALGLILLSLAAGLGFASLSPWAGEGISATTLGVGSAVALLLVQIISSGVGGYMAGRLRVRWAAHTDEVVFRDSAHGMATWAVAALVGASLLTGAAQSLVGGLGSLAGKGASAAIGAVGMAAGAADGATGAGAATSGWPTSYVSDMLMRSDMPAPAGSDAGATAAEVGRILSVGVTRGGVSEEDKSYLAKLVAARTGSDEAQARARVDDVIARSSAAAEEAKVAAKQAADKAAKAASLLSLWTLISLLSGAFAATYFAIIGGRLRDKLVNHLV